MTMLKVIEKVRSFTHKEVDFVVNRCSDGSDDYIYVCSQVRYTYDKLGVRIVNTEYRKSFKCDYYSSNAECYALWLKTIL